MIKIPEIAIIGAGFSGIVSAYNLVQQANFPLHILLFDDTPFAGRGVAYSTDNPLHLLNVPAANMGALHEDPKHFFHWMQAAKKAQYHEGDFVPRMLYGSYLQEIAETAKKTALRKGIVIRNVAERVMGIEKRDANHLAVITDRTTYTVPAAILAIGVPWTRQIPGSEHLNGFLPTFWPHFTYREKAETLLNTLNSTSVIGIIGSGLTMLDVLATLHTFDFKGKIKVFSKRGLLPQMHAQPYRNDLIFQVPDFPKSALKLLKKMRELCASEISHTGKWQNVLHALRPITSELWHQLSTEEKRKIIRHLLPYWNSHRHRAAPQILSLVRSFQSRNQLELIKAHVTSVEQNKKKIAIHYTETHSNKSGKVTADLVVNCSGPDLQIKKHPSALVHHLLTNKCAEPDTLGLGIAVDEYGSVCGNAHNQLFAVGSILFGTHFETIAVPELREQCHRVASRIVESLQRSSPS